MPAGLVNVGSAENVTPINKNKVLDTASKLELEEGTPTIVNIPLGGSSGMASGGGGGASSEKTSSQGIPNIPSSDFANTSIAATTSSYAGWTAIVLGNDCSLPRVLFCRCDSST